MLSSTSREEEGDSSASYSALHMSFGTQGDQGPPPWAKELFQQQAEILHKLKNIPQGRQECGEARS